MRGGLSVRPEDRTRGRVGGGGGNAGQRLPCGGVNVVSEIRVFSSSYPDRFSASFYHTLARSRGNVQDLSNLKRRRFDIGENTGHFVYSADLHLELPGLEITGEYARSSVYSRYPAEIDNRPAFDDAPRFADRGSAYFLNAVHNFKRGLVGGELFYINPGFSTELRSYLHSEPQFWRSHLNGLVNDYMYWQTVDDNDDGDRYPDIRHGNLVATHIDQVGTDLNGVFLDQDVNKDGAPDTNRDLDRIPDYEEPFLMFDVEPNDYHCDLSLRIAELAADSTLYQIEGWVEQLNSLDLESSSSFRGEFKFRSFTEYGTILVGGDGPNYYGADAALIIDLGGDDIYRNNCGAPPNEGGKRAGSVGLIVDLAGNDRYLGAADASIGSAIARVGMLFDKGGDDIYVGANLTQGSGFGGVGVVWDASGNDIYIGHEGAQASAFFGVGLLIDESGHDFYSAWQIRSGVWQQRRDRTLARQGGERFLSRGQVPSLYAGSNQFSGWAQGVGCGFRGFTPGGIGMLADGQGDDQYQGGDFSQGCGYFFGLGLLYDGRGEDDYRGGRYAQGAAAHQAIGVVVDAEGNDSYAATTAASQGSGWDASIGILEDRSGDDRYRYGTLCQGAGSMNGLGVLLDREGVDSYAALSGQGQGHGGSTRYWGGRNAKNIGILIDLEGDDPVQSAPDR